jgi:hypothetical protein
MRKQLEQYSYQLEELCSRQTSMLPPALAVPIAAATVTTTTTITITPSSRSLSFSVSQFTVHENLCLIDNSQRTFIWTQQHQDRRWIL